MLDPEGRAETERDAQLGRARKQQPGLPQTPLKQNSSQLLIRGAGLERAARPYAHSCWCGLEKTVGRGGTLQEKEEPALNSHNHGLENSSQLLLTMAARKNTGPPKTREGEQWPLMSSHSLPP